MNTQCIKTTMGFLFVFLLISIPALAKNNQTLAIGGGVGSYNFNDEDLNQINKLLYGSEFLEWYVWDDIGIGVRSHKFYKTDSSAKSEEFLMATVNLSLTWVFLGSSDDFRMAVYAGYGPGGVSYSNEAQQSDITATADTSSVGIFLDWGSERWGARVGYHLVSASFDYQQGSESGTIDGSGNSFDFGIRLAF